MVQITDWTEQTYQSHSKPLSASRVVNMFSERQVEDARPKAPNPLWGAAGTGQFAVCGNGPVLGFTVMNDLVYAVTGEGLWQVNPDGSSHFLGAAGPSPNGVSIANNGITIVFVDGFAGWTYTPTLPPAAPATVKQITDAEFTAGNAVAFFQTYFVFSERNTGKPNLSNPTYPDPTDGRTFFLSPQNWNGSDPFDPTLRAVKEASSDLLVTVYMLRQQLMLMGEKTIEVWYNAGTAPPAFPFARFEGAFIQRGTIGPYASCIEANTLYFLGDDLIFYQLNGYEPQRKSNHGTEAQWVKYSGHRLTKCFSFTQFGHKMIVLTFPEAKATWVFDTSTERWHERESWLSGNEDSSIGKWRVNCALMSSSSIEEYPEILLGDSQSGRVDQLNNIVATEFGAPMRDLVIGPPFHSDRKRVFMKRFEIDVEAGVTPYTVSPITEAFCAPGVTIATPSYIATASALASVAAFSTFIFSDFVYLPDIGSPQGQWFGNQPNDASPGSGGLQIGIFNDTSSSANHQIVVRAWDASNNPIVSANYAFTTWSNWVWIGISCNTATHVLQVWINDQVTEVALTPAAITWTSTNSIPNTGGAPWHLIPASGP